MSASDFGQFVLTIAAFLAIVHGLGYLAERLKQPRIVGEILAGILLGPFVLKFLLPGAYAKLFSFSTSGGTVLGFLYQMGLILLMFCSGAALYVFRERIALSGRWLVALVAVVAVAAGHDLVFGIAYTLVLPYAMLCAAYLPRGRILEYNRLGDYSYGVYIYAYPVQQSLMNLWPTLGPVALFGCAMCCTLVLAILSWHFIEKPATGFARRKPKTPAALVPSMNDT